jgi:hypothetical protein
MKGWRFLSASGRTRCPNPALLLWFLITHKAYSRQLLGANNNLHTYI